MICGDAYANGRIDNLDKNDIWLPDLNKIGYYSGDFDMNGAVLSNEKQVLWKTNSGKSSKLP
jgi:hypothetical protein